MPELPRGTVAFLFTDVEGSTRRWERDASAMAATVDRHLGLLGAAVSAHGGHHFKTVGDAVQAAFPTAAAAAAAALDGQRALLAEPWGEGGPLRVRMALHVGAALPDDGDYLAPPLNRLARLLAAGHGGQVLLTLAAADLARDDLPAGAALRDLGEHRLRDLSRPERVFQLLHPDLPSAFPPLKTLDHRPNNLPTQPTPFLGREREVAAVVDLLRRDDVRLLTLTGPGGVGKTRLALQAAADLLDDFPDGVFFVPLAPVADPALVPAAVAEALGVREEGGLPLLTRLCESIGAKTLLLLLDNVEHLGEAAPAVAELLGGCANLNVLVTSRVPLRLRAEREYPVPPFPLPRRKPPPTVKQVSQFEAVRLFIDRARAVRPNFAVDNDSAPAVAEICHRLDGLPLAIELAAARVRLLSPQAMLARLETRLPLLTGGGRDLPAQQRTLRAAIAWSHDLLDPDDRVLFRRLAVFAGGFGLEAAERIGNPDGALDTFGGLERLVEQNLIRRADDSPAAAAEPRFAMLETIREYGVEQLAASGEETAYRQAHAELFLALAEQAEPALRGPTQAEWLDRLTIEHDNLSAALTWASAAGENETALRLAGALWRFWYVRGHLSEGRSWLERALAQGDGASPAARAMALRGAGMLAEGQGDYDRAVAAHEASLALWREVGNLGQVARSLDVLGNAAHDRGDYDRAAALHEQAVALAREAGDRQGLAFALHNLGSVALYRGQIQRAADLYEESLALTRALGDVYSLGTVLSNLGVVATRQGDVDRAVALFEESLALRRRLGDRQGIAHGLSNLADLARVRGDAAAAGALYSEALQIVRELGDQRTEALQLFSLGELALERDETTAAAALLGEATALYRRVGDRLALTECLETLGELLRVSGRSIPAARLLGAASALRTALAASLDERRRSAYDRTVAETHDALGGAAFAAAWAAGEALPLETAVAEAEALAAEVERDSPARRVAAE